MVPESPLENISFMKMITYIKSADLPLWGATLADLMPLWLLSFIYLPYPVSWKMAGISLVLSERLLMLYPPRFRAELAPEIRDVIFSHLEEAEK